MPPFEILSFCIYVLIYCNLHQLWPLILVFFHLCMHANALCCLESSNFVFLFISCNLQCICNDLLHQSYEKPNWLQMFINRSPYLDSGEVSFKKNICKCLFDYCYKSTKVLCLLKYFNFKCFISCNLHCDCSIISNP